MSFPANPLLGSIPPPAFGQAPPAFGQAPASFGKAPASFGQASAVPAFGNVMKQFQQTGLHVQGKRITEISGPTALYYLKPPGPRKGRVDLPYILFFSDSHFSSANECRACTPPNCYRLPTKEFVQLLDGLAKEVPIDFYVEMGDLYKKKELNPQGGPLAHDMVTLIRHCGPKGVPLPNDEKDAAEVACPTKYLRWHDSDPRTMEKAVESRLFEPFMVHLHTLRYLLHTYGYYDPKQDPFQVKERHAPLWKHTFSTLFSRADIPTKTHRIVTEILTSLRTTYKNTSLIGKQYNKSHLSEQGIDVTQLIPLLVDGLLSYPPYMESMSFLEGAIHFKQPYPEWEWIRNYVFSMIVPEKRPPPPADSTHYHIPRILEFGATLYDLLLMIPSMFVDLYTLFRMFKTPRGNIPGSLVLGNFGARHVERMVALLTHPLFGYQISYHIKERYTLGIKQTQYASRCQKIEKEVRLEEDVREHYRLQTHARSSPNHSAGGRKRRTMKRKTVRRK